MSFDGSSGVNLPGTQQLLNSTLKASEGFTYEAWFTYVGGGVINSIIDYAGTEKLVRETAGIGAAYRNNSANPLYQLGPADPVDPPEWHYAAVVFKPTSTVDATNGITGDLTFYYDSNEPTETVTGVRISDFGDSLNRTISVGAHPLGFGGDFYNGLIYEPRVTLGALEASELLYGGQVEVVLPAITALELAKLSNSITRTSTVGANYRVEYSSDLEIWNEAGTIQATEESTTFTQLFEPNFQELADAPELFYRVMVLN